MSEILKLPTENKVILKLFFESVTASSRHLRGLRRLNKPGTAKPDIQHLRELKTLPNPNRGRKNEISRMASSTKWENFQGHVFNSKIRSQKNTEETQGCIERNKTFIKKVFKLFRRPG